MISRWMLPGPARNLADIAACVAMGEHVFLCVDADFDLRLALEPLLALHQRRLHAVLDDPSFSPSAVLWREHSAWHSPDASDPALADLAAVLGRETWWIEGISIARVPIWSAFLTRFADAVRNIDPHVRPTIVLCLPAGAAGPVGLTITEKAPSSLTRGDLEVAGHYATAAVTGELLRAVRVSLAVEIAARELPRVEALETLQFWLDAHDAVLTDPAAIVAQAEGMIAETDASILLWRAQVGPVTRAIDHVRCSILRAYAGQWQLPFTRPPGHVFPATILSAVHLELGDMIEQINGSRLVPVDVLVRLRDLRHARNRLSHLSPVTGATLSLLSQPDQKPGARFPLGSS